MAAKDGKISWAQSDSETEKFSALFQHVLDSLTSKYGFCSADVFLHGKVLRKIYAKLRPWKREDFEGINYDEITACCGYLRNYALCHAVLARSVCFKVLEKCKKFKEILNRKQLHILSIGGGPGNDLLGFCSALHLHFSSVERLELTVLDKCSGWDMVFEEVVNTARNGSYGDVSKLFQGPLVTTGFEVYDLLSDGESDAMKTADILIMSKVLSEIRKEKKRIILENIFSSMKTDALFVYLDIDAGLVKKISSRQFIKSDPLKNLLHIPDKNVLSVPRSLTSGITKCTFGVSVVQKTSWPSTFAHVQGMCAEMGISDGAENADYYFDDEYAVQEVYPERSEGDSVDGASSKRNRSEYTDKDDVDDDEEDSYSLEELCEIEYNDDDDDDVDEEEEDSDGQDDVRVCQCAVEHRIDDYTCIFKTKPREGQSDEHKDKRNVSL